MAKTLQLIVGNTPMQIDWAALRKQRQVLRETLDGAPLTEARRVMLDNLGHTVSQVQRAAAQAYGADGERLVYGKGKS